MFLLALYVRRGKHKGEVIENRQKVELRQREPRSGRATEGAGMTLTSASVFWPKRAVQAMCSTAFGFTGAGQCLLLLFSNVRVSNRTVKGFWVKGYQKR